jgi:hypothetical protein
MSTDRLVVGWREWVALPELGIPAIEAKVDTGAQTSVLHAFAMDLFEEDGQRRVCFGVHPLRKNEEVEIFACADVVDERVVASSRGQEEHRVVIRTPVTLARQTWPIELTLTDRRLMEHRMLLGRTALEGRAVVDPSREYLHGEIAEAFGLYS